MAVEFGVGDRNAGRDQHDLQRSGAGDDVDGGAQGYKCDLAAIVVSGLVGDSEVKRKSKVKSKSKVKGNGQECPFHTTCRASPGGQPPFFRDKVIRNFL
jgi:hypothetical protein